jgi:hypothetical protein
MSLRSLIIALLSFFNLSLSAQDISGVWVGNYERSIFMDQPDKLVVEIYVYNDSLITGISHLYYGDDEYEHYKIYGVYDKSRSTVYFSEDSTIAVKLGFMITNCMGNYFMKLKVTDTMLTLKGRWSDNNPRLFGCPTTGVWLQKELTPDKKQSTLKTQDKTLERSSDIQSLIEISENETDSIEISIFDNGVVDNDSISLYLNDSLLIQKQLITNKPISVFISLDKKIPLNKILLAAENLGSIPPCTAYMIIRTKKKRYEVNLSSSFSSNAVVEFFLKE